VLLTGQTNNLCLNLVIKNIIANTAKGRNERDESAEGGETRETLMQAVVTYSKQREMVLMNNNEQEEVIHHINDTTLKGPQYPSQSSCQKT
jgi:hypothetical protein